MQTEAVSYHHFNNNSELRARDAHCIAIGIRRSTYLFALDLGEDNTMVLGYII